MEGREEGVAQGEGGGGGGGEWCGHIRWHSQQNEYFKW